MLATFNSLFDLMDAFPDEQTCIDHLRAVRWRDGESCPYCGSARIYHFTDRKTFKCGDCRTRFSIKAGTIFADTKLPLRKWFMAIWLITNHPKGIASTTLAKDLKVTQKTAWFVLHRLRHAARTKSFNLPLEGEIEVDETYIGGKAMNRHGRKSGHGGGPKGKTPVVGAKQRGGKVVARVLDRATKNEMQSFIRDVVSTKATLLETDEHPSYKGMPDYPQHKTFHHHDGDYSDTNSIESVWALLKRPEFIIGYPASISPDTLTRWLGE
jgi:transposase-like protein